MDISTTSTALRAVMTSRMIKNKDLAYKVGVTKATIVYWRYGQQPTQANFKKLLAALDLTEDEFLDFGRNHQCK